MLGFVTLLARPRIEDRIEVRIGPPQRPRGLEGKKKKRAAEQKKTE